MVVEFKAVEAIGSLVELLRAADSQAVHHYEQDEPFHPGIFPGLILLARLAADRAGEEFRQATTAAELTRWNANLRGERDELQQEILQVAAERDEAREQLAEMKGRHELQSVYGAGQAGRIAGLEGVVESLTAERDRLREQVAELSKKIGELSRDTIARLSGNSGELPETEPEPYQWQVGDEVEHDGRGKRRPVTERSEGCVFLDGYTSGRSQPKWESVGWKLHRKASDIGVPRLTPRHVSLDDDLPDIPPLTPQQVTEFAAVTEPIDDSVGTDGEGQS